MSRARVACVLGIAVTLLGALNFGGKLGSVIATPTSRGATPRGSSAVSPSIVGDMVSAVAAAFGPAGVPRPARIVLARWRRVEGARNHPQHAALATGLEAITSRFLVAYLNHSAAPSTPLGQGDANELLSMFGWLLETVAAEPPADACLTRRVEQNTSSDPCDVEVTHVEALFSESRRPGAYKRCLVGVASRRCRQGARAASTPFEAAARRPRKASSRYGTFTEAERRMLHLSFHVMQRSRWEPPWGANTTDDETPDQTMCAGCGVVKRMTQMFDINATLNVSCWSRPRDDGPGLCGDGPAGSVTFWNPARWRLSMDVLYAARENRTETPPPSRSGSGVVIDAVIAGMFPSSRERCRQIAELRERNILGPMNARRRHYLMSAAVRRPKTALVYAAPPHHLAGAALRERVTALQRAVPGSIDTWLVIGGPFSPAFGHVRAAPMAAFRTIYFVAMQQSSAALAFPRGAAAPDFTLWVRPDAVYPVPLALVPRGDATYMMSKYDNETWEVLLNEDTVYGSSINGVTKSLLGDTTLLIPMARHSVMAQRLYGGLHASCFRVMFRLTEVLAHWIWQQTRVPTHMFKFRDNIDGKHVIDSMDDLCDNSERERAVPSAAPV
jgi:hypothetical protein